MSKKRLSNNSILKKVSIAQNLRRGDIQQIFELAGTMLSFNQVGAYMLKPDNRKFIALPDDMLEAFLDKLIIYSRGTKEQPHIPPKGILNIIIDLAERDNIDALDNIVDCVNAAKAAIDDENNNTGASDIEGDE